MAWLTVRLKSRAAGTPAEPEANQEPWQNQEPALDDAAAYGRIRAMTEQLMHGHVFSQEEMDAYNRHKRTRAFVLGVEVFDVSISTRKFHRETCAHVKETILLLPDELEEWGFSPCLVCCRDMAA